jgi:hypothetical protein
MRVLPVAMPLNPADPLLMIDTVAISGFDEVHVA